MFEIQTHSAEETRDLGRRLGEVACDGDLICLSGDLGAGKTTFAQGVALGLGITGRVTSPTFTVVQEYQGRIRLYHLDCYRLDGPADLDPLDAGDWLGRDGLTVIEWAERVLEALPPDRLAISLEGDGENRVIQVTAGGPASQRLLDAWDGSGDAQP